MLCPDRIEYLMKHGISYVEVIDRFGGNEALFKRLACRFLDDPHMDALESALADGDVQATYEEAHSLKGVAGNLSFTRLYLVITKISNALHDGSAEEAEALMPEARRASEDVREAMRTMKYCWSDPE